MQNNFDFVVIGAGVVGLAIANALLDWNASSSVVVLEKEAQLAAHASGRNSGVLHAGFYYAPDSLKAQLTRRGNELLHGFCEEAGVPLNRCGKVVVAQNEDELSQLDVLFERGVTNGVNLEFIDVGDLRTLEPMARTFERAIWSPTTSVADPAGVVTALAQKFERRGGTIRYSSKVVAARPGLVRLKNAEVIECGHTVNVAGLYADQIAHMFGVGMEYRMLPFKGLYWYGNWQPGKLRHHVYPVPDSRNPFLGVHLTVTASGRTKIGPTAIPSLWREDYGRVSGFSAREVLDVLTAYPGFLSSPHHDVAGLIRSEFPKYSRRNLLAQAQKLVPAVDARDFTERGRPGVRAQLLNVEKKKLEMDFVVREGSKSTHVLNAVSPAWTSSLAFAEFVVSSMKSA